MINNKPVNHKDWVLYPSKKFPGKLYYFNVVNGAAEWTINDVQKRVYNKDHSIRDSLHSINEPLSPPPAEYFSTNMSWQHRTPNFFNIERQSGSNLKPVFGQHSFSKTNTQPMFGQAAYFNGRQSSTNMNPAFGQASFTNVERQVRSKVEPVFGQTSVADVERQARTYKDQLFGQDHFPDVGRQCRFNIEPVFNESAFTNAGRETRTNTQPIINQSTFTKFGRHPGSNVEPDFNQAAFTNVGRLNSSNIESVVGQTAFPNLISNVNDTTSFKSGQSSNVGYIQLYLDKGTQTNIFNRHVGVQTIETYPFDKIENKKTENPLFIPSMQSLQLFDQTISPFGSFQNKSNSNTTPSWMNIKKPIVKDIQNKNLSFQMISNSNNPFQPNFNLISTSNKNVKALFSKYISTTTHSYNEEFTVFPKITKSVEKDFKTLDDVNSKNIDSRDCGTIDSIDSVDISTIQDVKMRAIDNLKVKIDNVNLCIDNISRNIRNVDTRTMDDVDMRNSDNVNLKTIDSITQVIDNINTSTMNDVDLKTTDNIDLRVILNSKKRKNECINLDENVGGKKIKTTIGITKPTAPKKRVTFKDQILIDENCSYNQNNNQDEQCKEEINLGGTLFINKLKNLAKSHMRIDMWYVAVDTTILLEDFDFIDKFVQKDETCRLFIPHAVRMAIQMMSSGDSCGQQRVILARQIARKLINPPERIVVQPCLDTDDSYANTSIDNIINCCLRIAKENIHLVLVSNDMKLLGKAKSVDICSYEVEELKNELTITKITFDGTNNECYSNNNIETPVNVFKKVLFESRFQSTDLTRLNEVFTIHKDVPTTSEISRDIEKLKINEEKLNFERNFIKNVRNIEGSVPFSSVFTNGGNDSNKESSKQKTVNMKFSFQNDVKQTNTSETVMDIKNEIKVDNILTEASNANVLSDIENIGEEQYERFSINNKITEEKIKRRLNEWLCFLRQIMEEVLTNLLQKLSLCISTPFTMLEAIEHINNKYKQQTNISATTQDLKNIIIRYLNKEGNFDINMEPKDLMQMYQYSSLLIRNLKVIIPQCPELEEGEELLEAVLDQMENPTPPSSSSNISPLKRSILNPILLEDGSDVQTKRRNFVKDHSEIEEYLEKHYPQDELYKESSAKEICTKNQPDLKENILIKVLRTSGKNLKFVIINKEKSSKSINTENKINDDKYDSKKASNVFLETKENIFEQKVSNEVKDTLELKNLEKSKSKFIIIPSLDIKCNKEEIKQDELIQKINEENKLCCNNSEELFSFYNNDINIDNNSDFNNSNIGNNKKLTSDREADYTNEQGIIKLCDKGPSREISNENEIDSEAVQIYACARYFLSNLTSTYIMIHRYIMETAKEIRKNAITQETNTHIHDTINRMLIHLDEIIDKLKCVVHRESNEATSIKKLIMKAGIEARTDKRMTNYRQVIKKCIEQGLYLRRCLKILFAISGENFEQISSVDSVSISPSIQYLNVFE